MRESQKMCLDYKLHNKIIASIIMIQRWFKSKLQRDKFKSYRMAAVKIQSYWRMHLARNKFKAQKNAAIVIQSTFKMFRNRKVYKKLIKGLIMIQAHIRGKAARIRFKCAHQKKLMKDQYKLRTTQSLPINERYADSATDAINVEISRSYPKLIQYSGDVIGKADMTETSSTSNEQESSLLHKAEHQFRTLMVSTKTSSSSSSFETATADSLSDSKSTTEDVDSRSSRTYNISAATKQFYDESVTKNR